jgi:hypothetical protein
MASAPELFAVAAEHYLAVSDPIDDPRERRQVVSLLRRAANQAALTGDYGRVNSYCPPRCGSSTPAIDAHSSRCTRVGIPLSSALGGSRRQTTSTA